jgi:exoribonuclease-2
VYTAAAIFPMLAERLSTDLTSLGEGEDRLALVIEMAVTSDGAIRESALVVGRQRNLTNSFKSRHCGVVGAWLS